MTEKQLIKDLFYRDVTREIPPVVYFHEQDPAKVAEEVAEYIITGGFETEDRRHERVPRGIHDQMVKLLTNIRRELERDGGPSLPASWISGFYGSGKSSFAKLLGLSLDGMILPDGRPLADALIKRDDSPKKDEFRTAWDALTRRIEPIAVVFDIGSAARDDEHIPMTARRQVQLRLGYCARSHHVADYELKLELEGRYTDLDRLARQHLEQPWSELAQSQIADEHFSLLMHHLYPDHHPDPMSWLDARAGSKTGTGTSPEEVTKAIAAMLEQRAPGATLFLVIDEVSQYIHRDEDRQLRLQSFVSDLGQRLRGRVWLLCTGQQQLEDSEDAGNIGKLKDRFPEALRIHLEPSNIRDVVHKRLLRKDPRRDERLRELFRQHKRDLQLNGFGHSIDQITEEEFVEVYPLLPEHVELFMQITSSLRLRSSRVKGDDYAIRGLLQTLGEMFREQRLAEREVGELITLDAIYDVHHTAFDVDTKNAMDRLRAHDAVAGDDLALAVAKAVSLLQLVQESLPTTVELVAQCLYPRLGAGNRTPEVGAALERMRDAGLLAYSEKHGYKLQSAAGQEWQRERDKYAVTSDQINQLVMENLRALLGTVKPLPQLRSTGFSLSATFSDEGSREDERLLRSRENAVLQIAFLYRPTQRDEKLWRAASGHEGNENRLLWVVGDPGDLRALGREVERSRHSIRLNQPRLSSLSSSKQRCLFEEQTRCEELEARFKNQVARAFLTGSIYFRGRHLDPRAHGDSFATVVQKAGENVLPELYSQFDDTTVTAKEIEQLLELEISGADSKLVSGLGILEFDQGHYVATCKGEVPGRIRQYVEDLGGVGGAELLTHFGGPPHGYRDDLVKACLAGLLRGRQISFRLDTGAEITSFRDEGAASLFRLDRPLKRADILPAGKRQIDGRTRNKIVRLLRERLHEQVVREEEPLADAVFRCFPPQMERLRDFQRRFDRLPGRPALPERLRALETALERCLRSRQVDRTLVAVKKHYEDLVEGLDLLERDSRELTDDRIEDLRAVAQVCNHQAPQLLAAGELAADDPDRVRVDEQLAPGVERPWCDLEPARQAAERLAARYRETRRAILNRQVAAAEAARQRLKGRDGFARLDDDQRFHVLSPIEEALPGVAGGEDALAPTLVELRDGVGNALRRAEEEAIRRLDRILAEVGDVTVVPFELGLTGRELKNADEVEDLVSSLRQRLLAQLDEDGRVRIRLV